MPVLFDLRNSTDAWASPINEALASDRPEYFTENGKVGSDEWWGNYESGKITNTRKKGTVTFIGERPDFFNEI